MPFLLLLLSTRFSKYSQITGFAWPLCTKNYVFSFYFYSKESNIPTDINEGFWKIWKCEATQTHSFTLREIGLFCAEQERNHCEQPFAFPSSMRELVLPHVMHHLIVSVYFRDLRWKLLFALRNRFISVYRTRKQRDLSIYSKRGEKVQKFTGKVYRKSEFFKKG